MRKDELEELQWEAEWELVSVKCSKCGIRDYEENMCPLNYTWSNKWLCMSCETLRRKSINRKKCYEQIKVEEEK